MKKYLFAIGGILSLGTGVIGIFVPILPTTPFLLLAASCFLKSSKRLYNWLMNHRVFGKYIENYIKYRAISTASKIASIVILWTVIIISILFMDIIMVKILLVFVAIGVTWHLMSLKSLKNISDNDNADKEKNSNLRS